MAEIEIKTLSASPKISEALGTMLTDVVANGGSVGFMHPLAPERARAFWDVALAAAERGERIMLGAFDGAQLVATVTLLLDLPPNQPHRAEIAKMMTRPSYRGRRSSRSSAGAPFSCSTLRRMRARRSSTSDSDTRSRARFRTTRSSRAAGSPRRRSTGSGSARQVDRAERECCRALHSRPATMASRL